MRFVAGQVLEGGEQRGGVLCLLGGVLVGVAPPSNGWASYFQPFHDALPDERHRHPSLGTALRVARTAVTVWGPHVRASPTETTAGADPTDGEAGGACFAQGRRCKVCCRAPLAADPGARQLGAQTWL